jgi:hypothetical protein
MQRLIAAAFLAATLIGAGAANAMPLVPIAPDNTGIIKVAGGCGPGFHRDPYGGCLQTYANPDAHVCPGGYHIGPNGGCRGNGR